jgi:hypothetical protein
VFAGCKPGSLGVTTKQSTKLYVSATALTALVRSSSSSNSSSSKKRELRVDCSAPSQVPAGVGHCTRVPFRSAEACSKALSFVSWTLLLTNQARIGRPCARDNDFSCGIATGTVCWPGAPCRGNEVLLDLVFAGCKPGSLGVTTKRVCDCTATRKWWEWNSLKSSDDVHSFSILPLPRWCLLRLRCSLSRARRGPHALR